MADLSRREFTALAAAAVKAGANVVIIAQPTFYAKADVPAPPAGRGGANQAAAPPDPVFTGKNEFIARNGLVVRLTLALGSPTTRKSTWSSAAKPMEGWTVLNTSVFWRIRVRMPMQTA